MAIFGNKKKSVIERLDELLAEIDRLPEDEQEKVWAHFDEKKRMRLSISPTPKTASQILFTRPRLLFS